MILYVWPLILNQFRYSVNAAAVWPVCKKVAFSVLLPLETNCTNLYLYSIVRLSLSVPLLCVPYLEMWIFTFKK